MHFYVVIIQKIACHFGDRNLGYVFGCGPINNSEEPDEVQQEIRNTLLRIYNGFFLFSCFTPMVMVGRSVHLTTLYRAGLNKRLMQ